MINYATNNSDEIVGDFVSVCLGIDEYSGRGSIVDRSTSFNEIIPTHISGYKDAIYYLELIQKTIHFIESPLLRNDLARSAESLKGFISHKNNKTIESYKSVISLIYNNKITKIPESIMHTSRNNIIQCLNLYGINCNSLDGLLKWRSDNSTDSDSYSDLLKADMTFGSLITKSILQTFLNESDIDFLFKNINISVSSVKTEEDWIAYCFYDGSYTASIELNSSREFYKGSSTLFALHETMPGHVTEAAVREYLANIGKIHKFYTLQLLNTPRNLLSEGMADYFPELFRESITLNSYIGFLEDKYFTDCRHNVGLDLVCGTISFDDAVNRLCKETLCSQSRASKALRFAINWDCYFPTYASGFYEVKNYHQLKGDRGWRDLYLMNSIG